MITIAPLTDANRKLIERVYRVYPDERDLGYWSERMRLGGAFVFDQYDDREGKPELVYSGIVEICQGGLNAVVGGGIDGRIDVPEMYRFLVSAAKYLDKSSIRLTGRLGWWKYLRGLGFKQVHKFTSKQGRLVYVYEKEVH